MQLVYVRFSGSKATGGSRTHAQDADGRIACGRKLDAADVGMSTDNSEWHGPSCKQCQLTIARGWPILRACE
jgi:hypothetical protein